MQPVPEAAALVVTGNLRCNQTSWDVGLSTVGPWRMPPCRPGKMATADHAFPTNQVCKATGSVH